MGKLSENIEQFGIFQENVQYTTSESLCFVFLTYRIAAHLGFWVCVFMKWLLCITYCPQILRTWGKISNSCNSKFTVYRNGLFHYSY